MTTTTELWVHLVILWGRDVVHTALLRPGERFVVGDGRNAWACPTAMLPEGKPHVLVDVAPTRARFVPPGGRAQWLTVGQRASHEFGQLCVLASAGVSDGRVLEFRKTQHDAPLLACGLLAALAHLFVLTLSAFSLPPMLESDVTKMGNDSTARALVALQATAVRETAEPKPEVALFVTHWLQTIDGWSKCGGEFHMGVRAPQTDGRYALAGPRDNPDPHLARANGPPRPALNDPQPVPPIPSAPPPRAQRDPDALVVPWGRRLPLGTDELSVRANMWGKRLTTNEGRGAVGKRKATSGKAKHVALIDQQSNEPLLPARVVHTNLRVTGGRPNSEVADALLTRLGDFRTCYATEAEPGSRRGHVDLVFTLHSDGTVLGPTASNLDEVSPRLASCLIQALSTLRLGATQAGPTTVVYPLELIPPQHGTDGSPA